MAKAIMDIERFFDQQTMSVHIKENTPIMAKRGRPGAWEYAIVRKTPAQRDELQLWVSQIVDAAQTNDDSFIEIEREGSIIAQIARYRIVITRPPFADGFEITAVRPVRHLDLADYKLSEKLQERVDKQAEGILIAGAPGHGKSTFATALAEHYATFEKVIKTVEAPRDMVLPDSITQYAISHGSAEEVHDVLLLSRPDYTFFDEMRNTEDFQLFADMRLSGVGMIGVMHATKTIDAIQRFLGRIELGVIPHVVDTVIFIKDGGVDAVYAITMTVKVPSGMTEADLARPIVEVHDFQSGKLVYEIYTYGEQTIVVPVSETAGKQSKMHEFAQRGFQEYFEQFSDNPRVEVVGNNKIVVYVADNEMSAMIGKGGERIKSIEQELGVSIDLQENQTVGRKKKSSYSVKDHMKSKKHGKGRKGHGKKKGRR
jgi:ATPase